MNTIAIRRGRVVDPHSGVDAVRDVFIADGRVAGVGRTPAGFDAGLELDAAGCVVCPGLVDLRARLREPGDEHKADVTSETLAAVAGGITTLCVPPDTAPVVDTPAVAELIHQRASASGRARVEVVGALTQGLAGERLAEMGALGAAGCVGVSNALRPVSNTEVMRRALQYAATFGLTVFVHAEDAWLARAGVAHEGPVATRLGLAGNPGIAESIGVARDLLLAEDTGARVHFCHLSTAAGVEMVRDAIAHGLPVSADVAVAHLHLCDEDLGGFEAQCHVRPPLRSADDRAGLRAALADGTVSAVCSDHEPHEADAKLDPLAATQPGISGLETLLPLTLRLVEARVLTLGDAVARLTAGPAAVLGLDRGRLARGAVADVCVFEPDVEWTLAPDAMRSHGHNTPFAGQGLRGRVCWTLVGGRVAFDAGRSTCP